MTDWNAILALVPLLLVVAAFTYGVARSLLRVWLDHRLKLSILQKYEAHPELFDSSQEVLDLLARQDKPSKRSQPQDYAMTGILLAVLGAGGVAAGHIIALGNLAVGLYVGGIVCLVLGILIALLGFLIRALGKNTLADPSPTHAGEANGL